MFYWVMKNILVGPLLRVAYRPWVEGRGNVPRDGAAILAGNHLAVIDSFLLPLMLPRQVKFLAKSEYFTGKGLKGRVTAWFMSGIGTVPIDRSGGAASEAAIRTGLRILGDGDLLGIYPEGTRSPDGRLYKAKTGVARMALETGVPVIPVVMVGTDEAQPVGRTIPRFMPLGARIGEPLDFSHLSHKSADHVTLRRVADEITEAILALSDQEYVDVYAATEKAGTSAGRPSTPATRYLPTQRPAQTG